MRFNWFLLGAWFAIAMNHLSTRSFGDLSFALLCSGIVAVGETIRHYKSKQAGG